jgi:PAP2 superfamily protein
LRRLTLSLSLIVCTASTLAGQSSDAAQAPPSFGSIFSTVPGNLVRFVSIDTAKVLGIGGASALLLHPWDDDVVEEVATNKAFDDAFAPGDFYGAFLVQTTAGFITYGLGRATNRPHVAQVGANIVGGQFVSQPWAQLLKHTVRRERPDGSNQHSFPSGHTASAFATASVLQESYGWKVGAIAYFVAGYVGSARMVHNRHYLSDVAFGAAIGIAGARTVVRSEKRRTVAVNASYVEDGVGIIVSITPRAP